MEHRALSLSQRMRRDAELRYDSVIPLEIRAAISAQERIESDLAAMRAMDQAQRLRFMAAREFQHAKASFRTLAQLLRSGVVTRPSPAWRSLQQSARQDAEIHLECWHSLRQRERARRRPE
jgi:hypothetical protein